MKSTKLYVIALPAAFFMMILFSCRKQDATVTKTNSVLSVQNDSSTTLDSGLVAWYPFNGDVSDHSGHNNNVVYTNARPTAGKGGLPNTAYKFNGIKWHMVIFNSPSLNPTNITLFAVIKTDGFFQGRCHINRIIDKGRSEIDQGRYNLGYDDHFFYHNQGCSDSVAEAHETYDGDFGDAGITDTLVTVGDKWVVLAMTYDGTTYRIYKDGNLQGKAKGPAKFVPSLSNLYIGTNSGIGAANYFKGIIDEIRIYNRALSGDEIKQLYQLFQ